MYFDDSGGHFEGLSYSGSPIQDIHCIRSPCDLKHPMKEEYFVVSVI